MSFLSQQFIEMQPKSLDMRLQVLENAPPPTGQRIINVETANTVNIDNILARQASQFSPHPPGQQQQQQDQAANNEGHQQHLQQQPPNLEPQGSPASISLSRVPSQCTAVITRLNIARQCRNKKKRGYNVCAKHANPIPQANEIPIAQANENF